MSNPLHLIPGQKYIVTRPFTDYDKLTHEVNESWIFIKTNFVPYHDGLTLHVQSHDDAEETVYRLQWTAGEQADIIDNFKDYVKIDNDNSTH